MYVRACVRVCVCVHECVCACMRACVSIRADVKACVCVLGMEGAGGRVRMCAINPTVQRICPDFSRTTLYFVLRRGVYVTCTRLYRRPHGKITEVDFEINLDVT